MAGRRLVLRFAVLATSLVIVSAAASARNTAAGVSYQGNGGKSLPPFHVNKPSTLEWAAQGGIFQLFSAGLSGGDVNSAASHGWSYLTPGTYQYTVNGIGAWRIRVVSGVVAPVRIAGGYMSYAGSGGMTLPPIHVRTGTLYWRGGGGIFQLFSSGLSGGDVNSQASSGKTYLTSGTYEYTVNTTGPWKIWWKP